ncbi:MAG: hypothetical protein KKB91_06005 [Proteobacteria bacterium]|jgi:uncharacterized protein|nr:hypothetical protein [Pseudomonadota bacterium]MCG2745692.1 hypothetical protein [Desulfobacteraceae bacterium]
MSIITPDLLSKIREQYSLNWHGTHGIPHWHRVWENGIKLSEQQGINAKVLQLFAVFHDSQRMNENTDPNHGPRGAELALEFREHIPLDDEEFTLLTIACCLHTSEHTHSDITIQACFDADRLDLGRVGITPDAYFLNSKMAKNPEMIEWALRRSIDNNKLLIDAFGIVGFIEE